MIVEGDLKYESFKTVNYSIYAVRSSLMGCQTTIQKLTKETVPSDITAQDILQKAKEKLLPKGAVDNIKSLKISYKRTQLDDGTKQETDVNIYLQKPDNFKYTANIKDFTSVGIKEKSYEYTSEDGHISTKEIYRTKAQLFRV
jgi:hypothetical protein